MGVYRKMSFLDYGAISRIAYASVGKVSLINT